MATNWVDAISKGAEVLGELTTLHGQLAALYPAQPTLDSNGQQITNGHSILMDVGNKINVWLHRQNIEIGSGTVKVTLPHAWDMDLPLAPEARAAALAGGATPSVEEHPPATEKPAKPPGADAS